jgi:thiamine-monophosphate kinase
VTEDEFVSAIASILTCHPERSDAKRSGVEGGKVFLGIGDDAALWQPSRSHRSAISTDMLVENVHFTRDAMSLEDIGWRAMAANLSDLAAMGAKPLLATVALGFPRKTAGEELLELYRGLVACATQWKTRIVGGDLSAADALTVAITIVGEVRPSNVKTRSGGKPGDVVAVTGPLGAASAGLQLTRRDEAIEPALREDALSAFRRPQPRIAEGKFFAASRNVGAMMDISDGLSTDLHRLAVASNCGATIECVPVAESARALAERRGENAERVALASGEDFELLVAIRPRAFRYLEQRYAKRFKRELLRVGILQRGSGVTWNGAPLERSGWDHFQRS